MTSSYRKRFIPLESDPEVFNRLIHSLGVPLSLSFQDVWSFSETNTLPHPTLALILIFPTTKDYEIRKDEADTRYDGSEDDENIIWFEQTIDNACGLYSILHSLSNSGARTNLDPHSLLNSLLNEYLSLSKDQRPLVLEDSDELERLYTEVARQGSSRVPEDAEEVDFHYVCFAKSDSNQHVYELDGDRKGPIDTGLMLSAEDDLLTDRSVRLIKDYIKHIQHGQDSIGFSLMALVQGS